MQAQAQQPDIFNSNGNNLTGSVAPDFILGRKYYLQGLPGFYFIVREDKWSEDPNKERVCLYFEGAVNEYLRGNNEPFDLWLTNEFRGNRSMQTLQYDMTEKAEQFKIKRYV